MPAEMSVTDIRRRKDLITQVMRDVMKPGEHYGKIPGTEGKALLKSGAEMLGMTFRLAPHFDVHLKELDHGHREYTVTCTLTAIDGTPAAVALGSCSTMESKYRWRNAKPRCPVCHQETVFSRSSGDGHYCWKKKGGCGANFEGNDRRIVGQPLGRVENPDIADQWNTVLKMAVKRAHVAAVLLATAASDMFKQEEEAPADLGEEEPEPPREDAQPKAEPAKLTEKQELAHECAKIASGLGRSKEEIAELINAGGGYAPKDSWNQLTVGELRKAREILAEEATLTQGGA